MLTPAVIDIAEAFGLWLHRDVLSALLRKVRSPAIRISPHAAILGALSAPRRAVQLIRGPRLVILSARRASPWRRRKSGPRFALRRITTRWRAIPLHASLRRERLTTLLARLHSPDSTPRAWGGGRLAMTAATGAASVTFFVWRFERPLPGHHAREVTPWCSSVFAWRRTLQERCDGCQLVSSQVRSGRTLRAMMWSMLSR